MVDRGRGKREISCLLWLNIYLIRNGVLYRLQSMNINEACQSACLSLHRLSTSQMLMEQCHELPRLYHGCWKARLRGLPRKPLDRSSMVFLQLHVFAFKKLELSAWYFLPPPPKHSKTVHKIYKMGLSVYFLPLLLPPFQLPVSL